MLGSKEEISNFISNSGSTLFDLSALHGSSPDKIAEELTQLGVPLPSMNFEGTFDFIKNLQRGVVNPYPARDLIRDPIGGVQHMPVSKKGALVLNAEMVYRSVHGDKIVDPYLGVEVGPDCLRPVDDSPENLLVTNIEALSQETWASRFEHGIGMCQETFKFSLRHFEVEVDILRRYDQLVGGTYNPEYVHQLFFTWVGSPLNTLFRRNPEEDVIFNFKTPTTVAWWIWSQLSNYAFLKGIRNIRVTSREKKQLTLAASDDVMQHCATLNHYMVLGAIQNEFLRSQASIVQRMCAQDSMENASNPA